MWKCVICIIYVEIYSIIRCIIKLKLCYGICLKYCNRSCYLKISLLQAVSRTLFFRVIVHFIKRINGSCSYCNGTCQLCCNCAFGRNFSLGIVAYAPFNTVSRSRRCWWRSKIKQMIFGYSYALACNFFITVFELYRSYRIKHNNFYLLICFAALCSDRYRICTGRHTVDIEFWR